MPDFEEGIEVSTSTVESPVDVAPAPDAAVASPEAGGEVAPVAVAPEWIPNYKVKAYDSEYEIPELFRGHINKENEAEYRKIFEKAYGLDVMSGKNAKLRETNTNYEKMIKETYEPLDRGIKQVSKYLQNKDFDRFFETLKIEQKELEKWMLQKLSLRDLPPEQQELYSRQSEAQKRAYDLESQAEEYRNKLEGYEAQQFEAAVQQRANELEQVLSRPEIRAMSEKFDSRKNQPGAFKEEVIQRAQFILQTQKKDLSAEDAVKDFASLLMFEPEAAAPQPSAAATNPNQTVLPPKEASKPTLPSLAGKTSSPAAQKVKTLDDLYKLKKQMELRQN